jgi:predicted nucleotidyltransferase
MTQFRELLQVLSTAGVEFIIVGGVAAFAHGVARVTLDLDLVYRRTPANLGRIVDALAPYDPYPRGAPEGLPFHWDARTVQFGINFTLRTRLGFLDLLGEITAGGTYDDLLPRSHVIEVYGMRCRCLELDELIRVKRAVGRPKDFEAVAELEALRDEQSGHE